MLPDLHQKVVEIIQRILQAHSGTIEAASNGYLVRFPAGTLQRRKFPVTLMERYDISFPDGYTLLCVVGRDGIANLGFAPDEIPDENSQLF